MGAESGRDRTYDLRNTKMHVFSPEVLHGVLYPEAHNNGIKKKKKTYRLRVLVVLLQIYGSDSFPDVGPQ